MPPEPIMSAPSCIERLHEARPILAQRARRSRPAAIRLKCLECCDGSGSEVKVCGVPACPLYPWRTGRYVASDVWKPGENGASMSRDCGGAMDHPAALPPKMAVRRPIHDSRTDALTPGLLASGAKED